MGPRVLEISGHGPDPMALELMARHLDRGGLVAMPTETVYGFGSALMDAPIRSIQALKGRGPDKPFLVLAPSLESVGDLSWTEEAEELARVFWPGALTLILTDQKESFPAGVRSPRGSVAVRLSPHPVAMGIVRTLGAPVTSTSANLPGTAPALTAETARDAAVSLGAGEEMWVVDAGPLEPSPPSTIIDCSGLRPAVSRIGAIPLDRLRCVVPDLHEPI